MTTMPMTDKKTENHDQTTQGSILCGDCIEVLSEMEDDSVDLTVFSPPYDNIRDYNKEWTLDIPTLGQEILRVTKDGGICAVVIGDGTKNFAKSLTTFRWAVDWCDKAGWRLFECCIYSRHGNPGAWWSKRFRVDHEYILIFLKGKRPKHFNKVPLMVDSKHAGKMYSGTDRLTNGGLKKIQPKAVNKKKCRGTLWNYATSNSEGNKTKMKHPATFPDKLASDLIQCFSDENDTVLDPMCGSGTTAVMAAKLQRKYIGIEFNSEYCDLIADRLKNEVDTSEQLF
jgi:DNA modification methylase